MIRIIIVGFGNAGRHYFSLIKKKTKKIYIIEKNLPDKFKKYQITTKDIVRKNISIDHAIIATPSNFHFKYAEFFLKRKCHVLIEKPFVLKIKDGIKLIKLAKKVKKKCWTSLQNRYNLATQKLASIIKKGELGKIELVNCSMYWSRDKKYYVNGWRGKYFSDGGVLANQAIHLLDILIFLFGRIKYFYAFGGFNKSKLEAEDLIIINIVHKNNIFSTFSATTRANIDYMSAIDVIGNKGRARVTGISLNIFEKYIKDKFVKFKKNSENFSKGSGPVRGMGKGHEKILNEFLNDKVKKSSFGIDIKRNIYTIKVIHSVYNLILSKKNIYNTINNKQGILGK
jgi:hypothetical protein